MDFPDVEGGDVFKIGINDLFIKDLMIPQNYRSLYYRTIWLKLFLVKSHAK